MKLRSLTVTKLPGLYSPIQINDFGPGMNFVLGPNASGKTSLIRALSYLLNPPSRNDPQDLILEAEFEIQGELWSVTRAGPQPVWRVAGAIVPRPNLPANDVLACHLIRIEDLLAMKDGTDESLAEQLQIEMDGGLRLRSLRQDLEKVAHATARSEQRTYLGARDHLASVKLEHLALSKRQAQLPRIDQDIQQAKAAQHEISLLQTALKAAEDQAKLKGLAMQRDSLPKALAKLTGEEINQLDHQEKIRERWALALSENQRTIQALQAEFHDTGLSQTLPKEDTLKLLKRYERELSDLLSFIQAEEKRLVSHKTSLMSAFQRLNPGVELTPNEWPRISYPNIERARALAREIDAARQSIQPTEATAKPKALRSALILSSALLAIVSILVDQSLLAAFFALVVGGLTLWDLWASRASEHKNLYSTPSKRVAELEDSAQQLAKELGFSPALLSERSGMVFESLYQQYQSHQDAYDVIQASIASAQSKQNELMQDISEKLPKFDRGGKADLSGNGILEFQTHLQDCIERLEAAYKIRDALERQARETEGIEQELSLATEAISAIYAKADLTHHSRTDLQERLKLRSQWIQMEREIAQTEAIRNERLIQLENQPDLIVMVEAMETQKLETLMESQATRMAALDELQTNKATLEHDIKRASEGAQLGEASGALQAASAALDFRRESCLMAEAQLFWLEKSEQATRASGGDRTFDTAKSLFLSFTQHQWELTLDDQFGAKRIADQAPLSLSELSTATRMQLLLAVRVARVLKAENHHEPLPLLVDEALTTSDPARATVIMQNLEQVTQAQSRQVIYLAASDYELQLWRRVTTQQPAVITLHASTAYGENTFDLALPDLPTLPDPEQLSPSEYAKALGVPRLIAHQAPDHIHLFYLLCDELSSLNELMREWRLTELGPFARWLDESSQAKSLPAEQISRWRKKCVVARRWWALWHQGKTRRIDSAILHQAQNGGGLTEKTLPGVLALAEELDFDPALLLDRLKTEPIQMGDKTRRLAQPQWQAFHDFLDELGTLSTEAVLNDTSRRLQALNALSGDVEASTRESLQRMLDVLEAAQPES